jgi:hypothetical protein
MSQASIFDLNEYRAIESLRVELYLPTAKSLASAKQKTAVGWPSGSELVCSWGGLWMRSSRFHYFAFLEKFYGLVIFS